MDHIEVFSDINVKSIFDKYPKGPREKLLSIRQLIFDTAKQIKEAGKLEESLKWGQPSYLTSETGSGSTIRIDRYKRENMIALYFNCKTNLVENFREMYSDALEFEGNRIILLDINKALPEDVLSHCIEMALTYHINKSMRYGV